ncbi:MAG TPA: sugar MFS transporter [Sphingorhabdus sp.]|jgi:FHS family L-fucose permease-like MFS transporter|uniref:sugar MFS transporter n=1 Tax=Sphingorhabdus sp. TaxID=1902408 RepID=UPI002C0AFE56|nr:sugar MFS transporter [Sphingorhabdus sp.]HMT42562.1 sugar MFS transporter [Sphingorhabdus sp.]HMU22836.1 sugar MFS transporter [Sphingorhabdus sp.]
MKDYRSGISAAFISVTTLFFAWGFITSNNDPLIASLKASFHLSYTEALITQLVFFAAYGFMSFPAAALLNRVGSVRSILLALTTMIIGCLLVQFIVRYQDYSLILAALFVLGIGITTLQVAANPLAAALGPPESSHFRLTFAQAFNSLGVVLGVNFGSKVMLGEEVLKSGHAPITNAADRILALQAVSHAFLIIAALLAGLMAFIWFSRRRISDAADGVADAGGGAVLDALKSRWALFGSVAIGLYVGAEVSIGSIMINFLNQPEIMDLPLETAGFYLANIYWMGALIGRFVGSYLLTRLAAPKLLMTAAGFASLLCLTVAFSGGPMAGYAALSVGLFNSIMFPTIFTITLERAGVSQASTSGLLCVAIVGGAILPYVVGQMADQSSLTLSFTIPMTAYAVIAIFGLLSQRAKVYHVDGASAPVEH